MPENPGGGKAGQKSVIVAVLMPCSAGSAGADFPCVSPACMKISGG